MFPLYYHDRDGLYTPLYGNTTESDWVAPFYYRNKTDFHTLLWSSTDTGWWTLFGLVGSRTNVARSWRTNWVFPFYSYRAERSSNAAKSEMSSLRIFFIPVW